MKKEKQSNHSKLEVFFKDSVFIVYISSLINYAKLEKVRAATH